MFDEPHPNKIPEPPKNLTTEPEDMFAGLDGNKEQSRKDQNKPEINSALNAGMLKKKSPEDDDTSLPTKEEVKPGEADKGIYEVKEPILGKVMVVLGIMILVGGVGYGVWKFYSRDSAAKPTVSQEGQTIDLDEITPAEEPEVNLPSVQIVEPATNTASVDMSHDQILFGESLDTDKDGLDDVRENELGTNINDPDTDDDGLNDADEVIIWKTDPLNPDTDGDGYKDGEEIRNGYNPLGPGKLFSEQNDAGGTTSPSSADQTTTSNQ